MKLNKFKIASSIVFGLAATSGLALAAPEASPLTANITVVSDYRFRGLSQSNFKPAVQGGFDYAHESGFYVGNWNSSISWIGDGYGNSGYVPTRGQTGTNVSAPTEMDFYAGFKGALLGKGFESDLGVVTYTYRTSGLPGIVNNGVQQYVNPNTTEVYVAQNFSFGALTGFAKASYAVTTMFGTMNSSGSYYPELNVNYDTGVMGLTLNAHIGYQYMAGTAARNAQYYSGATIPTGTSNTSLYSYTDYKLGVTKDFGDGVSAAAAIVGTNVPSYFGYSSYASPQGTNLGKAGGVVSLTKSF